MKNKLMIGLHVIIFVSAVVGILLQCGLGSSTFSLSTFRMFTTLSNCAIALFYFVDFNVERNELMKKMKFAVTMCIVLTGSVAAILLNGMFDSMEPLQKVGIFLLHDVTPIGTVLDWIIFDKKGQTTKQMPLFAALFPILYLIFVFVSAPLVETMKYPYPFIDITTLGIGMVIVNVIGLTIAFMAVGYLAVFLDHKLDNVK